MTVIPQLPIPLILIYYPAAPLHHKEAVQLALLQPVLLLPHPAVQQVRVAHAGNGVGDALHRGGDRHDLLDRAPEPLPVVVPVDDGPDVGAGRGGAGEGRIGVAIIGVGMR